MEHGCQATRAAMYPERSDQTVYGRPRSIALDNHTPPITHPRSDVPNCDRNNRRSGSHLGRHSVLPKHCLPHVTRALGAWFGQR